MSSDFKVLHILGEKTQCFLWDALTAAKDSSTLETNLPLHFSTCRLVMSLKPVVIAAFAFVVYQGKRGRPAKTMVWNGSPIFLSKTNYSLGEKVLET